MADDRQDPIAGSSDDRDLYGIAAWEPRSVVDRVLVWLTRAVSVVARWGVIALGVVLLVLIGGFAALSDPVIGVFTVLSALPALALAGYVYRSDVTDGEPPTMLAATFLLGVVTATFAAVVNGVAKGVLGGFGIVGIVVFFFLIVGPVEETVKLLAVWLYAYRDQRFSAVIDGAVYGAMAGLGFAFIENALYIERGITASPVSAIGLIEMGTQVTFVRALAGPGHVIYSAIAGYYLGLARFSPEYRVPIVLKGLGIAALIHGLYNTTVGIGPAILTGVLGVPSLAATFLYVLAFDGVFAGLLIRKLRRYRHAYHEVVAADDEVAGFTAPPNNPGGGASTARTPIEQPTDTLSDGDRPRTPSANAIEPDEKQTTTESDEKRTTTNEQEDGETTGQKTEEQ